MFFNIQVWAVRVSKPRVEKCIKRRQGPYQGRFNDAKVPHLGGANDAKEGLYQSKANVVKVHIKVRQMSHGRLNDVKDPIMVELTALRSPSR